MRNFRKTVSWFLITSSFAAFVFSLIGNSGAEKWPEAKQEWVYKSVVNSQLERWRNKGLSIGYMCSEYDHQGQYLGYNSGVYRESERVRFDQIGVPKVKYGEHFFYNPVTIAQYALKKWGGIINEGDKKYKEQFKNATEKLVEIQKENGALPYDFEWRYYLSGETYEPGWVSAMAQGQALSVFSRAYHMTQDPKYLKAGKKTFRFLITPKGRGGNDRFDGFRFFSQRLCVF